MFRVKCADLGSYACPFETQGVTLDDAREKIMEHIKHAHPDMNADNEGAGDDEQMAEGDEIQSIDKQIEDKATWI
ncbi:MAG: DUF1059 domain-containing protein [bacterium]